MIEPKLVMLLAVGILLLLNGILDITRRRYVPALQTVPAQGSSSSEGRTDEGL
jgi:hypothetical protein